MGFGEIGKIIGEKWKALGEEEKKEYQEMAQKDKVSIAASQQLPSMDYLCRFVIKKKRRNIWHLRRRRHLNRRPTNDTVV